MCPGMRVGIPISLMRPQCRPEHSSWIPSEIGISPAGISRRRTRHRDIIEVLVSWLVVPTSLTTGGRVLGLHDGLRIVHSRDRTQKGVEVAKMGRPYVSASSAALSYLRSQGTQPSHSRGRLPGTLAAFFCAPATRAANRLATSPLSVAEESKWLAIFQTIALSLSRRMRAQTSWNALSVR